MSDLHGDIALLRSLEADPVEKRGLFQNPEWLNGLYVHIGVYHGEEGQKLLAQYKLSRQTTPVTVPVRSLPVVIPSGELTECVFNKTPHPHIQEGDSLTCVEAQ